MGGAAPLCMRSPTAAPPQQHPLPMLGTPFQPASPPAGTDCSFMGIAIGGAVAPIYMALVWSKATAAGAMTGAISGTVLGLIVWLVTCQVRLQRRCPCRLPASGPHACCLPRAPDCAHVGFCCSRTPPPPAAPPSPLARRATTARSTSTTWAATTPCWRATSPPSCRLSSSAASCRCGAPRTTVSRLPGRQVAPPVSLPALGVCGNQLRFRPARCTARWHPGWRAAWLSACTWH